MTQDMLPKEPLDLPREPLEIPAHSVNPVHADEKKDSDQNASSLKTLLAWSAPGRPYRKRGKEFYVSSVVIALFIEIILWLFGQYLLMLVVSSFVFVAFALALVPPHSFHYKISTEGITIEDHFFLWQELYDFYFKKRDTQDIVHIRTKAFLPGELTLTLGTMDREHIKDVLIRFLPFREVISPTFMEKSGDWLSKNFPLEREIKASS